MHHMSSMLLLICVTLRTSNLTCNIGHTPKPTHLLPELLLSPRSSPFPKSLPFYCSHSLHAHVLPSLSECVCVCVGTRETYSLREIQHPHRLTYFWQSDSPLSIHKPKSTPLSFFSILPPKESMYVTGTRSHSRLSVKDTKFCRKPTEQRL